MYIEIYYFFKKIIHFKFLNYIFIFNLYLNIISISKNKKNNLLYDTRISKFKFLNNKFPIFFKN